VVQAMTTAASGISAKTMGRMDRMVSTPVAEP
jgi:hypothetical protein